MEKRRLTRQSAALRRKPSLNGKLMPIPASEKSKQRLWLIFFFAMSIIVIINEIEIIVK